MKRIEKKEIFIKKEEKKEKIFTKKEILDNLSNKNRRYKDGRLWYKIGVEKLLNSKELIDLDFTKQFIYKLKVEDLVYFYNKGYIKLNEKIKLEIYFILKKEIFLVGDSLKLFKKLEKDILR